MRTQKPLLNRFVYRNYFSRAFAFTLLFALLTELAYSFPNRTVMTASAGGGAVADVADGMVDLYTGDFRYSVPLLSVPGPNGENVSLSANYGGGIRMNQSASWIGLGWDLNPGEITRQVVGVPDDFAGQYVVNAEIWPHTGFLNYIKSPGYGGVAYYGPFHYSKIKTVNNHVTPAPVTANNWFFGNYLNMTDQISYNKDLYDDISYFDQFGYSYVYKHLNNGGSNFDPDEPNHRFFNKRTAEMRMAAYDNYYVSGPGIQGKLKPYIMNGWIDLVSTPTAYTGLSNYTNYKRTQFHFENSTKVNCVGTPGTVQTNYKNLIPGATFVRYYTNSEINDPANIVNSSTPGSPGFINYKPVSSGQTIRPATQGYDPDGIGGIQVTDANGITYHYSLPVYNKKQLSKQITPDVATNIYLRPTDNFKKVSMNYIHDRYAQSWKLTAVTGPDYMDKNNNKTVDEGDIGYWIQYSYGLWDDSFLEGSTYFNYSQSFRPNYTEAKTIVWSSFAKTYNISNVEVEKYYLDFIRTASHTAYFIKDTRMDNFSFEGSLNPGDLCSPELKLSKIVLLRNVDKTLIENNASWGSSSQHAKFKSLLFSAPLSPSLIHIYKYNLNKSAIDSKSLAGISFETNYGLCKGYYRNVHNSFNSVLYSSAIKCLPVSSNLYKNFNYGRPGLFNYLDPLNKGFVSTDIANSGKLTLKAIHTTEDEGVSLFDPYVFNYDENNTLKNPNYDSEQTDLWGYYKSDAIYGLSNSGYATPLSAQNVDAWSLKQVKTPSGGIVSIEYEADHFEREGYSDRPASRLAVCALLSGANKNKPCIILPINAATQTAINSHPNYIQYIYRDADDADIAYGTTAGFGYANISAKLPPAVGNTNININRFTTVPFTGNCFYGGIQNMQVAYNYLKVDNSPAGVFLATNATTLPDHYPFATANYYVNSLFPYQLANDWRAHPYDLGYSPSTCRLPFSYPDPYDQLKAFGYTYICLNKMIGGGLRVKSITINNPESQNAYKKEFSYEGGYCRAVPRPFTIAPDVGGRQAYQLWDNTESSIPYTNAGNVGYSKVTTRLVNSVSGSNTDIGKTVFTFKNDLIKNPLFCKVTKYPFNKPPVSYGQCATPAAHAANPQGVYHSNCFPIYFNQYEISSGFNDKDAKELGLLILQEAYNAEGNLVSEKKTDYDSYYFYEAYTPTYEHRLLPNRDCFNGHGVLSVGLVDELDNEKYIYYYNNTQYYYYLKSTKITVDGITTTETPEYDPVTGLVLKMKTATTTNGQLVNETVYAHSLAGMARLGFKATDENNLNILALPVKQKVYRDNILLSETRTDNLKSRMTRLRLAPANGNNTLSYYYTYINDLSSANGINAPLPVLLENFEKPILANTPVAGQHSTLSELKSRTINFFDERGHVLEAEGLNGRKAATRYGYNNTLPLAAISNAGYNSFAFSSFEDLINIAPGVVHYGGEVSGGATRSGAFSTTTFPSVIKPHSGDYMAKVSGGSAGPEVILTQFDAGRTYEAKVWVHASSPAVAQLRISLSGINMMNAPVNLVASVAKNDPANVTVGNWVLMKVKLAVPNTIVIPVNPKNGSMTLTNEAQLKISLLNSGAGTVACFDDLMVNPVDAPISGTVYDERTLRVKATLNSEGFGSYYYYDAAGRITSAYGETAQYGLKKLSETEYNNCKSFLMALPNTSNGGNSNQ